MPRTNIKTCVIKDIPLQAVDAKIETCLSKGKLAAILSAVQNNVSNEATIVHITSTYTREGADRIALEAAVFSATQEGENVLFIDVDPTAKSYAIKNALKPQISLDQYVLDGVNDQAPLMHINGMPLVYTKLAAQDYSGNLLFNTRQLKELLTQFKTVYDVIIVHSEDSLKSGAASILAPLVDSTVIVVQAERARHPVVKELIENITASGGKISGTIMSGRKYYIPKLIYKLFFNSESRD